MLDTKNNGSSAKVAEILGKQLQKRDLESRLKSNKDNKISIQPIVSKKQVQSDSIDLRLGTNFIIFKKNLFSTLDPDIKLLHDVGEFQEKIYVRLGDKIFLHPKEFILGSTLEYIKLPSDLIAYITCRSTWGRLGLVIATAIAIHPNFAGIITLELANLGDTPITLCPGIRIAQLIFHEVKFYGDSPFSSYQMSVEPSFSKVYREKEWSVLKKIRNKKIIY